MTTGDRGWPMLARSRARNCRESDVRGRHAPCDRAAHEARAFRFSPQCVRRLGVRAVSEVRGRRRQRCRCDEGGRRGWCQPVETSRRGRHEADDASRAADRQLSANLATEADRYVQHGVGRKDLRLRRVPAVLCLQGRQVELRVGRLRPGRAALPRDRGRGGGPVRADSPAVRVQGAKRQDGVHLLDRQALGVHADQLIEVNGCRF